MSEYFVGKRESNAFSVQLNKGKVDVKCTVWEYWHPLIIDSLKCGAQTTHALKRSIGVKLTEKQSLENALEAAIGSKELAQIKAKAKETVENEICWDVASEESRSVTFTAPKCGQYLVAQYQLMREYSFQFEEQRWFHKNAWQSSLTEHTSAYHDDSKQLSVHPDCNCNMEEAPDPDGLFQLGLGEASMLVTFRNTGDGIEAAINGVLAPVAQPRNGQMLKVPLRFVPESLRFLARMNEPYYVGIVRSVSEASPPFGIAAEAIELRELAGAFEFPAEG